MKLLNFDPSALADAPEPVAAQRAIRNISNAENRRMIQARFENQFTTQENRNLWALADLMSVDASASMMIRRTLRMRNRQEYHNNSYYQNATNRLARFVIGPNGPTLHMATTNKVLNKKFEASFSAWWKAIGGAEKLRVSRTARTYNGAGWLLMRTNPGVNHPVKLDLFEIEDDQVSSPLFGMYPANYPDQYFDGVILDPWGNPQTYHILRQHPGASGAFVLFGSEFDPYPARYVLHDYRRIRPGQQRGIPECDPACELFAERRRLRKAVLAATETAADHAGWIQSDAPGDGTDDPQPMDHIETKRRMMGVLPKGWKAFQMKAEQPGSTYGELDLQLCLELSQTLDMPLFFFTGDARLANMASAYVVTQSFTNSVNVDRSGYDIFMDRVLDEFAQEAKRVPGLIPQDLPDDLPHVWRWPRVHNHADPLKTATASGERLRNGTSSIPREAAMEGIDWEEEQAADAKSLGMTLNDYRAALRQARFAIRGEPAPAAAAPEPDSTNETEEPAPSDVTEDDD